MESNRPKMPVSERAKQFMPFAALKGLYEAYAEKEKIIVPKRELAEDTIDEINRMLVELSVGDTITAVYYENGEYIKKTGVVSEINTSKAYLIIVDQKIMFSDLFEILPS